MTKGKIQGPFDDESFRFEMNYIGNQRELKITATQQHDSTELIIVASDVLVTLISDVFHLGRKEAFKVALQSMQEGLKAVELIDKAEGEKENENRPKTNDVN